MEIEHHEDEINQEEPVGHETSEVQKIGTDVQNEVGEANMQGGNLTQNIGHQMITGSKAEIFKPKIYASLVVDELIETEPANVDEALSSSSWKKAMQEEYDTLMKNETWALVPPKVGMKIIGNKWVYRLKYDSKGRVKRHKAKLVAK